MADLRVDIASQFTGAAAFKKADKAVGGLSKSVSKLGRNLGLALGTTAFVSYSKRAVKAFAEDDKAAQLLTKSLDNLGLAFADLQVKTFISELETTFGVLDDKLRPAFQRLLTTTGSVQQSQALLRTALDLSAASGADVVSVAGDLSKAFTGQTRALSKYGLGLTQAELKAMSFEEIQAKITKLFGGQATLAANSYSGSLDKISVAAANAQEIIGKGLVDALGAAGGTGGLAGSLEGIIKLATTVSDLFVGIGRTIAAVKPFFTADVSPIEAFKQYQKITAQFRLDDQIARRQFGGAAAVKFQKESAALAKKNAIASSKLIKNQTTVLSAEQKKQAALKKAGTVFDLEQIQIVAALQGKISEDDKLRLKAQLALLNGNEVVATALTKQILMAQDQTGNLYKLFLALPDARNPFAYLEGYLNMLAGKASSIFTMNPNQLPPELRPNVPVPIVPPPPPTNVPANPFSQLVSQGAGASGGFSSVVANAMAQQTVVVQIDGKAVASALQDSSLSGIGSFVDRVRN
jgi:hypothetical protein